MSNFSAISCREQIIFDDIMSVLYQTNTLRWIVIVLDHWNNSLWVDMLVMMIMSHHSDILSRFKANQSLLFFIKATYLAEKQQLPNWLSLVWLDQESNPQSNALKVKSLTITASMWLNDSIVEVFLIFSSLCSLLKCINLLFNEKLFVLMGLEC